jgi:hypothetical protein
MKMNWTRTLAISTCAAALLVANFAYADSISPNTGSLGSAGDGTNTANVLVEQPGPLAAPGDFANTYSNGERTTVPFQAALNPSVASPFSVEFWARPTVSDNDDSPLANRIAAGNRSGWVFFQRSAGLGWNFRMYNGVGSNLGWDLTGGTSTLNAWSHVVATWNGNSALLYVNGVLADSTNDPAATGVYNPSTSAIFSVGSLFDGGSASTGSIDEVAYYRSALTPVQITSHFAMASNPIPGAYSSLVIDDGAVEYLQNNPVSAPIPGDIDMSGSVTRHDAALFSQYFGKLTNSDWSTGDFDGDHATTMADFAILQERLNAPASSSSLSASPIAAVPEPATIWLALGGAIAIVFLRQRRNQGA